ncbi:MAG: tRNA 2-thiouridine(34) synthase MnmA [Anaerolineae bacterium]|nr:tRNA 2-thiouridine(34) synthase MnmA [Anaerolineae bacterium]MDW8071137.1 tRNA 2-thiouridine(34) synthase MnmA [Anaerolineae bacterium]
MTERGTVVVAMSGGVDSAMAAALLVEQGYTVIGIMLRLWATCSMGDNRCCTPDSMAAARQVAAQLNIPFYVLDYREVFRHIVVDYFVSTYAAGRTPNPCILCNERIRFGFLLKQALALGAQYLATGHYARVRRTEAGTYQLLRGRDLSKDQSYVLHRLNQWQLQHVLFPLGDWLKSDVRRAALQRGLMVHDRSDSQDLCFAGDNGDYRAFIAQYAPQLLRPGPILDTSGTLLGQHQGLAFYTIGQRKGLGIARAQRTYVVQLDPARNAVIVGSAEELGRDTLFASAVHYISGHAPPSPVRITARIRYKSPDVPATLTCLEGARAHVQFDWPLRDITPGQAVVFYQGDVVLGGGFIE